MLESVAAVPNRGRAARTTKPIARKPGTGNSVPSCLAPPRTRACKSRNHCFPSCGASCAWSSTHSTTCGILRIAPVAGSAKPQPATVSKLGAPWCRAAPEDPIWRASLSTGAQSCRAVQLRVESAAGQLPEKTIPVALLMHCESAASSRPNLRLGILLEIVRRNNTSCARTRTGGPRTQAAVLRAPPRVRRSQAQYSQ